MASRRSGKRKTGIEEIREGTMEKEDFKEKSPPNAEKIGDGTADWWRDEVKKKEDLIVETSDTPIYTKVKLQSRISARVVVSGDKTISGKRYEWKRSGDIVEVEKEDAPGLLEKRIGDKTCCGGSPDNLNIFILVE